MGWRKVATIGKLITWQKKFEIILTSSKYLLHVSLESKNYRIIDNNDITMEGSTIYSKFDLQW